MAMTWAQRIPVSFPAILAVSTLIRAVFIAYAEWHDSHSVLKYTDVDYRVFSDATRYILRLDGSVSNVAQGLLGSFTGLGDPYTRETYRYTPLLALLLAPNEWIHPAFGKMLFSAADLLAGILIRRILLDTVLPTTSEGSPSPPKNANQPAPSSPNHTPTSSSDHEKIATLLSAIHLLNPMVFAISTRGSSESLLLLLVLLALRSATRVHWTSAAVWIGIATHWKIYPVIYGVSCVAVLGASSGNNGMRTLLNRRTIQFGSIAAGTFFALGGACYVIWGDPFLREAYLYHVGRRDHRHNFAPQFYLAYLSSTPAPAGGEAGLLSKVLQSPLASFVPQLVSSLGAGLVFGGQREHVPFVWFVQTACFVLFNKVCTSQYFLWYILFIPLLVPRIRAQGKMTLRKTVVLGAAWAGAQGLWLAKAYELEFLGKNVLFKLWIRGLVYVVLNAWVLGEVINGYC